MNDEHRPRRPPPRKHFVKRLALHAAWGGLVVALSDVAGTIGYRVFAGYGWIDAFLNASMLLGGMGPVGDLPTRRGQGVCPPCSRSIRAWCSWPWPA